MPRTSRVEPWRIIAITFTNKAADELKSRLAAMLGPAADDIWARTFHSACVRILRRDADKLGYPRSFTIYDTSDQLSVMKAVLRELDLDDKVYPPRAMLAALDKARDELLSPEAYCRATARAATPGSASSARSTGSTPRGSSRPGPWTSTTCCTTPCACCKEQPDVLEHYQRQFKYVLIDEYQDTNNLQYMLAQPARRRAREHLRRGRRRPEHLQVPRRDH